MKLLMEKLQMPIPDFQRDYRLKVELSSDGKKVLLMGVDNKGRPYTLFKYLKVEGLSPRPMVYPVRGNQQ